MLAKNRYQIIHSHTHYADNIANIASYFVKVKTLQTVHGIIEPIGRLNHYPSKYFVAVNEHVYDYLIKQKKKPEKNVRLIRYGIPALAICIRPINQKLKVISAGRLIPQKGFDIFIKAISKLKMDTLDKTEFLIAGIGAYESELKNIAEKLNVNITFIGEVKDLMVQFISTNIFVIPTRSQNEGFPLTIIEAALTENLIISSNFLGYNSILKDKINSLIFNLNDSDDLSSKLDYAIENYKDMNDIIERSYHDAREEFNIDKMTNKTIAFYDEILK